jgi:hypothetical protein
VDTVYQQPIKLTIMSYILTVHITKELVEQTKMCGFLPSGKRSDDEENPINTTCLFAEAFRTIFPQAWVDEAEVWPFGISGPPMPLPDQATSLIQLFDMLGPTERVATIHEEDINIPIPDYILEKLDISEVTRQLENHPVLSLTDK